jgi:hypothetical protein
VGIEFRIADKICDFELRSMDDWRSDVEGIGNAHHGSEVFQVCDLRLRFGAGLYVRYLSELYDFTTPEFLVLS